MKPDLVDKTKRAIAEYLAEYSEEAGSEAKEKDDDDVDELVVRLPSISSSKDSKANAQKGRIVESVGDVSSTVVRFNEPPSNVITFHQFTIEDLRYFKDLSLHHASMSSDVFLKVGNDPEYMSNLTVFFGTLAINGEVTGQTKILFDREAELIRPTMCKFVQNITNIPNSLAVETIANHIKEELDIVFIFSVMSMESNSVRDYISSQGVNTDELTASAPAFSPLMPTQLPNFLKSSFEFKSPWAASQDLESFVMKTATTYSGNDPVLKIIISQLLLLSMPCRSASYTSKQQLFEAKLRIKISSNNDLMHL